MVGLVIEMLRFVLISEGRIIRCPMVRSILLLITQSLELVQIESESESTGLVPAMLEFLLVVGFPLGR